jgi:hypothetical protein
LGAIRLEPINSIAIDPEKYVEHFKTLLDGIAHHGEARIYYDLEPGENAEVILHELKYVAQKENISVDINRNHDSTSLILDFKTAIVDAKTIERSKTLTSFQENAGATWGDRPLPPIVKGLIKDGLLVRSGKPPKIVYKLASWTHKEPVPIYNEPEDFYLTSISLTNIRCFKELILAFDATSSGYFSLLLGDNALGKTTLLRCIALGLCAESEAAALIKKVPGDFLRRGKKEGQIRLKLRRNGEKKDYTIETTIERSEDGTENIRKKTTPKDFPLSSLFVCGYGTQRSAQATVSFEKYTALNAVNTLFDYNASLQNPEVFLLRRDAGYRKRIERKLLQVLLLDDENHEIVYSDSGIQIRGPWGEDPLIALSDGYRTTFQWVMDFIGWLTRTGRFEEGKEIGGILLIDELEQHLHPRWQRYIIGRLREQFPKVHIIASTHTPLITASMADVHEGLVYRLVPQEDDPTAVTAKVIDKEQLRFKRADQILTSEAFGLPTTRSPESEEPISRYAHLLGKQERNENEEAEMKQLRERLAEQLAFGETPSEQMVEQAVHQALDKLVKDPPADLLDLETKRQLKDLFEAVP